MTQDSTTQKSAASENAQVSTDKVALITGASRGLGAALAEELGVRGWHVIALARTTGALEELDDRLRARGAQATLVPVDLCEDAAIPQICRSIHDRWGKIDLWAHTAVHVPPLTPAGHVALKDWDKTLATTLRATGMLIPMIEPLLRASDSGQALFFDDATARDENGGTARYFGAYGAAKAGQIALAQAWATENAQLSHGNAPRVQILSPKPMPTATRARFFPGEDRTTLTPCADEALRLLNSAGL